MKNCPFCKKEVPGGTIVCPFCSRILVEVSFKNFVPHSSFSQNSSSGNSPQEAYKAANKKPYVYFKRLANFIKRPFRKNKLYGRGNKWDKYKNLGIAIVIGIFLFGIYTHREKTSDNSSANEIQPISESTSQAAPVEQSAATTTPIAPAVQKPAVIYHPLANGTILIKNSYYLKGHGELSIDNGTDNDALAKLISTVTNKSIFTVYVAANSSYTIKNISDESYKLIFSLGKNWDNTNKIFTSDTSFEVFDDKFYFATTKTIEGDYEHTRYTTFSVTLNPVIGGAAETSTVDPSEFNNY